LFGLLSTTPEQSQLKLIQLKNGGESGIRTHGALPHGSFQDCFLKPLGHLSSWAPHTPYRMPIYDTSFLPYCQEEIAKSFILPPRVPPPAGGDATFLYLSRAIFALTALCPKGTIICR